MGSRVVGFRLENKTEEEGKKNQQIWKPLFFFNQRKGGGERKYVNGLIVLQQVVGEVLNSGERESTRPLDLASEFFSGPEFVTHDQIQNEKRHENT